MNKEKSGVTGLVGADHVIRTYCIHSDKMCSAFSFIHI